MENGARSSARCCNFRSRPAAAGGGRRAAAAPSTDDGQKVAKKRSPPFLSSAIIIIVSRAVGKPGKRTSGQFFSRVAFLGGRLKAELSEEHYYNTYVVRIPVYLVR